jgi:quercetin dioxygenase-like cupin family protein
VAASLAGEVRSAQVVLPCPDLETTLAFFIERLGFRIESIHPADAPAVAVVSGYGVRLRLQRDGGGSPGLLRLLCRDPLSVADGATELTAPNGTRIELVAADPPLLVPPLRPSFVLSRSADATWVTGRAGMLYRDLVPDRQDGAVIASHIRIETGGPVADYVHHHNARFQAIYCYKGWVRLVYEDQGPPFVMQPGDCVLQPPGIRHRVLECSAGLEVIEVACPAEHQTFADHELALPTPTPRPHREFAGQRFVRHEAGTARWRPWRVDGFECRDTGIAAATGGFASVQVARVIGTPARRAWRHDADFLFLFVLAGVLRIDAGGHDVPPLGAGDAVVLPAELRYGFAEWSPTAELLEVAWPAAFQTHPEVSDP